MAFQLETSGRVECPASFQHLGWAIWSDLDPIMQGYVKAAMRSLYEAHHSTGIAAQMSVTYLFSDLAPATLERIITDCVKWRLNGEGAIGFNKRSGAALWKDRNADQPTQRSIGLFPRLTLYLGDDGKVRFAEAQS